MTADTRSAERGLAVAEVARRYRVAEDKVRRWIQRGELPAVNTAATRCGRPRWVILPDALDAFERGRTGLGAEARAAQKRTYTVDYYPG